MAAQATTTDPDLDSIRDARTQARSAQKAQARLAELSQDRINSIVAAAATAAAQQAQPFARLAVEETGYGNEADKARKNLFAADTIYRFIQPMRTVGIIRRIPSNRIVEIAEPFGVVAAIVPSTNPTSTAIYKILICLKARCAVVLSPHPSAVQSIHRVAEVMTQAALSAGAPDGAINCMTAVTLEGTKELMSRREVSLVLATGGLGLVRAAYSSGKPAYGVGPGNAPAYVERTADLPKAVSDIITGKTFDNGVLCSSENSVVVDELVAGELRREFERQGGHFLSDGETELLATTLVTNQGLPNPEFVGKTAIQIAGRVGIEVPRDTRVLIAPLTGVGRNHPLSIEKLCPVLAFYVVEDWRAGCERCTQILQYGGMGHTMSIHSQDEKVILEFGLRKPAFRIVVNTPTTLGAIGMTTGLAPSMTLGCGGHGGNITSDNLTPHHLLNIKRLAYETQPVRPSTGSDTALGDLVHPPDISPPPPKPAGIDPTLLARRVESFLESRGVTEAASSSHHDKLGSPEPARPPQVDEAAFAASKAQVSAEPTNPPSHTEPVSFVCEEDVRQALLQVRVIVVNDRTIITPAARDLGDQHSVFVQAELPR